MQGTGRRGSADTTMTVRTTMIVLGRTVIVQGDAKGTTVLALTDSVSMATTGGQGSELPEEVRRSLQGTRVQMRVAPDGSMSMLNEGRGSTELQALVPQLPASLPDRAVTVGERWEKVMDIPLAGREGTGGKLRTIFRLDSLSPGGRIAYISMRGEFTRDSSLVEPSSGVTMSTTGQLRGSLRVDRRLGWMTDSRATITMKSVMTPPASSGGRPMRLHMRITQRTRTLDKR
jgi:hypothetical protein